ncbi:MAG: polysaccharide deacetylase family protein [Crocinitomicaceae bacterium]|nr:polysaccharide deacetylase family protein [Crocinitomicaceae bacterium]
MYLTFDDGPTPELTNWILDYLDKENVQATFFCVGSNAKKYPELMERMTSAGHVIGNHTMRHEKGTKVSRKEYLSSIEEASNYIDSKLFRPPYGRLPMIYGRKIRSEYQIIMWSWLSYDYDNTIPVTKILEEAYRIKNGDILVVHDNEKVTGRIKVLLPQLIQVVRDKGLKFEVLSDQLN